MEELEKKNALKDTLKEKLFPHKCKNFEGKIPYFKTH
jgi:hypothetical protein